MKFHLTKRSAINIEPALMLINQEVETRLKKIPGAISKYDANKQIAAIPDEVNKAIRDVKNIITIEIRKVEETLKKTTPNSGGIADQFPNT